MLSTVLKRDPGRSAGLPNKCGRDLTLPRLEGLGRLPCAESHALQREVSSSMRKSVVTLAALAVLGAGGFPVVNAQNAPGHHGQHGAQMHQAAPHGHAHVAAPSDNPVIRAYRKPTI